MSELDRTWAETQVEAMADGSLARAAEQRMHSLMARDPQLARRVEAARQLRAELSRLRRRHAPAGLMQRLWRIPSVERPYRARLVPAFVMAAVVAMAVGVGLFYRPAPTEQELAQQAAVQDLATAMSYLQMGVILATSEVNRNVGAEMKNAFAVSREAIGTEENDD